MARMRYVDLEGNITIHDDPRRSVFLSHAHDDHLAMARGLIEALLEDAFVRGKWGDLGSPQAAEDQMILTPAFKNVVDAWRHRKRWGKVDPGQALDAYFAAAWRFVQSLDDEEYDAVDPAKIAALMEICDPDYALTGQREDNDEARPLRDQ